MSQQEMFKGDRALNYSMNQPHESKDAYVAEFKAFAEGVQDLRKKHRMANVLVVVQSSALDEGEHVDYMPIFFIGNIMDQEGMAAYAFGQAVSERENLIQKYMASGKKRGA